MTATAALLLAAALGQLSELAPLRDPSADGTTQASGANAHRDLAPARESPLGDLVFRAPLIPGGTDALPHAITLNGVSVMPTCAYRAKDATDNSWPAWDGYGETLTKVEGGANTSSQSAPHLGRDERLRQFADTGDHYQPASATVCQVGAEDMVIEAIVRMSVGGNSGVFATTGAAGGVNDWILSETAAGGVGVYLRTGGVGTMLQATAGYGVLVHLLYAVDRNYASATYGGRLYLNGVNAANADISARSASINSGDKFTIGAHRDGGYVVGGAVLALRLWKQADWLPGTAANATMLDALAADRSARFWGTRESVAQFAPTFAAAGARCAFNTAGKLDCYSATAPILGATIPPGMTGGGTPTEGGYLSAPAGTQVLLQSRALNTTWTAVGVGTVAASSVTPFLDARTAYNVIDNDAGGEEYVYQDIDITALGTGDKIALCPYAATESGTQVYTVSVTEQTGGSCTTTTTHYKPTATTTWQSQVAAHTVLDGDCTSARIALRPYDVASGVGATGTVAALMNAYTGRDYCQPYYVESTTATVASGQDVLTYDVASILGTAAQKRLGGAWRLDLARMGSDWVASVAGNVAAAGLCPSIYFPASPSGQVNLYWNSTNSIQLTGGAAGAPGAWAEYAAFTGRTCSAGDCGLMLRTPAGIGYATGPVCTSVATSLAVGGVAGQFFPYGLMLRNVEVYR